MCNSSAAEAIEAPLELPGLVGPAASAMAATGAAAATRSAAVSTRTRVSLKVVMALGWDTERLRQRGRQGVEWGRPRGPRQVCMADVGVHSSRLYGREQPDRGASPEQRLSGHIVGSAAHHAVLDHLRSHSVHSPAHAL